MTEGSDRRRVRAARGQIMIRRCVASHRSAVKLPCADISRRPSMLPSADGLALPLRIRPATENSYPIGYDVIVVQCLFTLPVSCVMFQKSANKSTPKFRTPSRDNTSAFWPWLGLRRRDPAKYHYYHYYHYI